MWRKRAVLGWAFLFLTSSFGIRWHWFTSTWTGSSGRSRIRSFASPLDRTSLRNRTWPRNEGRQPRSEEHTSELQSRLHLVCRLLLEKKNTTLHTSTGPHIRTTSSTSAAPHMITSPTRVSTHKLPLRHPSRTLRSTSSEILPPPQSSD